MDVFFISEAEAAGGFLILSFESIKKTALFFNTSERTIVRKLDTGNYIFFILNLQYFLVKRVSSLVI